MAVLLAHFLVELAIVSPVFDRFLVEIAAAGRALPLRWMLRGPRTDDFLLKSDECYANKLSDGLCVKTGFFRTSVSGQVHRLQDRLFCCTKKRSHSQYRRFYA